MLCLYRYWAIIAYFFPYRDLIGENWDNVLRDFIPLFLQADDDLTYQLTVLKMTARIRDSHAKIKTSTETLRLHWGENTAPVAIAFIDNQAVVTRLLCGDKGLATGLHKGDILLSIDAQPIGHLVGERLPFIAASNDAVALRDIARSLFPHCRSKQRNGGNAERSGLAVCRARHRLP